MKIKFKCIKVAAEIDSMDNITHVISLRAKETQDSLVEIEMHLLNVPNTTDLFKIGSLYELSAVKQD